MDTHLRRGILPRRMALPARMVAVLSPRRRSAPSQAVRRSPRVDAMVSFPAHSRMGIPLSQRVATLERILQQPRLLRCGRIDHRQGLRLKQRKQSMRQLKDAAEHERTVRIVEAIGSLALETAARRNDVPGNKPQYFRGALVRAVNK